MPKVEMSNTGNITPAGHKSNILPDLTKTKVAHELANLLDGSMRNVNLVRAFLAEQAGNPTADVTQRLQSAEQGMRQMATLLKHWLQSSATDDTVGSDTASIQHVVELAHRLVLPRLSEHRIALSIACDSDVAHLQAGPLYHVFANALRNSIDAIVHAGPPIDAPRIELSIKAEGGYVSIRIDDNGPGVPHELLDAHGDCRIGETTKPDGHGIGLAVCRDIADELAGSFRLTNRAPRGASFTLQFPIASLLDG